MSTAKVGVCRGDEKYSFIRWNSALDYPKGEYGAKVVDGQIQWTLEEWGCTYNISPGDYIVWATEGRFSQQHKPHVVKSAEFRKKYVETPEEGGTCRIETYFHFVEWHKSSDFRHGYYAVEGFDRWSYRWPGKETKSCHIEPGYFILWNTHRDNTPFQINVLSPKSFAESYKVVEDSESHKVKW